MINFPIIKRENVATIKGNFYVKHENKKWYKMELYLPCAIGTHNEELDETASRYLNDIESGKRPFKYALTDEGNINSTDYSKHIKRWFRVAV